MVTNICTVIENFVIAPNSFDIILYVDNNETSGSHNSQNDEILLTLKRHGTKYEVKDLKVGDFVWVCKDVVTNKELILPYIVERKRMDDFAHSIKDKRYHEQKFRLKKSGIENLIYLVESHGRNQHVGLPLQTLHQAATNTAIQEGFFIKFTENTRETVEYLSNFSRILTKMFKSKTLASCPKDDIQPVDMKDDLASLMTFKEFNESSVKNKEATGQNIPDNEIEIVYETNNFSDSEEANSWKKYIPINLKKPITTNLLNNTKVEEDSEPATSTLTLKRKNENLNNNIETPKQKKTTPVSTSRRRPTTLVKSLARSELAEKYDTLLDRRLELVSQQQKKIEEEIITIKGERELKFDLLKLQIAVEKEKLKKLE